MGTAHVTVTIRNPADPARSWDGLFLVDTGATDRWCRGSALRQSAWNPRGSGCTKPRTSARLRLDFALARIKYMGNVTAGRIIIGDAGVESLLGVMALESTGIEVDPVNYSGCRRYG